MNKLALLVSFLILFVSCSRIDCDELPNSYTSYDEAVKEIKAANFKIQEKVNTSKSSWIRGASFYSCDGNTGFFILQTDSQEYIYSDVPVDIWEGFKSADSFGSYYDYNIKHRFFFKLN